MRSFAYRAARAVVRSSTGSTEIPQFVIVLFILFLFALVPMLDISALLVAAATQYLATNDLAGKAATQPDYQSALNSMFNEAGQFQMTGLAEFVRMVPSGGFTGCGDDLYMLATNIGSGVVTKSSADQPLTQTINTSSNMYELSVASSYSVTPLISLASVPGLGSVPGLSTPVTLSFTANRPLEHPGGFQTTSGSGSTNTSTSSGKVALFSRVATGLTTTATATNSTWRNPNIFTQISNAGQTVVSVSVLNVPADMGPQGSPWWKNTALVIQAGQNVWIDTQATGTWGFVGNDGGNYNIGTDANGMTSGTYVPELVDANLPQFMLIGYIGNPPLMPYDHVNTEISGDPNFVPSGNYLLNYPSAGRSGSIWLTNNDNWQGDNGSQTVRVIITQ